ncbi:MAG: phosphatidylserine decarboxylase family protein [Bacteroidales bacterium]|nr:phosphatidylserine decarboxylase family protein [Bacteroidales bacterium]
MRKINKRIHEEGNRAIIITFLVWAVVIVGINLLWPHQDWWHIMIYVIAIFVSALIVRFFRIPIHRKTTIMENAVISPADGEIAANEIVMEDEYFHEERRQISIFMSIYNVHINFFPFDGEVTYYKYHPGKFLVAFKPKSSTENEHNSIVIKDAQGREVLVRQIAGFVARRIVCDLEPGDASIVGEEFGMIRFGSRVDVFLPVDAEVNVHIGQKVRGKSSVLATLRGER